MQAEEVDGGGGPARAGGHLVGGRQGRRLAAAGLGIVAVVGFLLEAGQALLQGGAVIGAQLGEVLDDGVGGDQEHGVGRWPLASVSSPLAVAERAICPAAKWARSSGQPSAQRLGDVRGQM
ncbi:hypothetical protein [Streptomyces chartreusis]